MNEVVVNAEAGICWEKTESTHGLKTPCKAKNQKKGNAKSAAIRGVGTPVP